MMVSFQTVVRQAARLSLAVLIASGLAGFKAIPSTITLSLN